MMDAYTRLSGDFENSFEWRKRREEIHLRKAIKDIEFTITKYYIYNKNNTNNKWPKMPGQNSSLLLMEQYITKCKYGPKIDIGFKYHRRCLYILIMVPFLYLYCNGVECNMVFVIPAFLFSLSYFYPFCITVFNNNTIHAFSFLVFVIKFWI